VRKIIVLLIYIISLYAGEYKLGEGKQISSLPLYVGGYFSLDYRNIGNENRYRINDLAVMGYGNYDKFSYMSEFEFKSFYVDTRKNGVSTVTKDQKLHRERVYFDYHLNENYTLRAGKYSSPIGYWNLLPINVLRQTTSSPISTHIIFPEFTTGLQASYKTFDDGEFSIDVMLQNNRDLDDTYNNYKIDKHYGFNVLYEQDDYSLKLNGGYFENINASSNEDKRYYFMLSGKYDVEKYQIQAEIGLQDSSKSSATTPYAGYIQGVYRLNEHHNLVARAEAYKYNILKKKERIGIVGYAYRPIYPVSIKAEYQLHSISAENQILFSVSVLF